jgi:hypothetical protein
MLNYHNDNFKKISKNHQRACTYKKFLISHIREKMFIETVPLNLVQNIIVGLTCTVADYRNE